MSIKISSGKVTFYKGNRSISSLNGITDSQQEEITNYIEDLENTKNSAINDIHESYNNAINNIASQAETAVNNYINEHQQEFSANATIQDNSITLSKIAKGTLGFVTPEMWGAAGNGSTDDTAAVRSAFQEGCKKYLPIMLNGTYKVTSKISLNAETSGYGNRLYVFGNGRIKTVSTITNGANSLDWLFAFENFDNIYIDGIMMYHDSVSTQAIVYSNNPANTAVTPDNVEGGIILKNCTSVSICNCRFSRFKYGVCVNELEILTDNEFVGNKLYINNCNFYDDVISIRAGSYDDILILNSFFQCNSETSGDTTTPHADNYIWATCNINRLIIDSCDIRTFNESAILLKRPQNTITINGQTKTIDEHIGDNGAYRIKDVIIHSTTIIGKVGNGLKCAVLSKSDTDRILLESCSIRRTVPLRLPNEKNHNTDVVKIQSCVIDTLDEDIWLGGELFGCAEFGFYDCRIRSGRLKIEGRDSIFAVYFKDCYYESISTASAIFGYIIEGTSAYLYLNDNTFKYADLTKPKNNSTLPLSAFKAKSGRIFAYNNRFDFNETGTTVGSTTKYTYVGFVFENSGDPPNGANAGANSFILSGNIVNIHKNALKRNSNGTGYGFFANKAQTRNLMPSPNFFPNPKTGIWEEFTTQDLLVGKPSDLLKYS